MHPTSAVRLPARAALVVLVLAALSMPSCDAYEGLATDPCPNAVLAGTLLNINGEQWYPVCVWSAYTGVAQIDQGGAGELIQRIRLDGTWDLVIEVDALNPHDETLYPMTLMHPDIARLESEDGATTCTQLHPDSSLRIDEFGIDPRAVNVDATPLRDTYFTDFRGHVFFAFTDCNIGLFGGNGEVIIAGDLIWRLE